MYEPVAQESQYDQNKDPRKESRRVEQACSLADVESNPGIRPDEFPDNDSDDRQWDTAL
jgi:hypothetical protein